jgi:hypothetical protein
VQRTPPGADSRVRGNHESVKWALHDVDFVQDLPSPNLIALERSANDVIQGVIVKVISKCAQHLRKCAYNRPPRHKVELQYLGGANMDVRFHKIISTSIMSGQSDVINRQDKMEHEAHRWNQSINT